MNCILKNTHILPILILLLNFSVIAETQNIRTGLNNGTVADFDGDGRTDISVFRPSSGFWYIKNSSGGVSHIKWGLEDDNPVPADYDGDGTIDVAVHRKHIAIPTSGTWFVLKSSDSDFDIRHYASQGIGFFDIAVPADYDGDGITDLAYYQMTDIVGDDGTYFVWRSSDNEEVSQVLGQSSRAVPADYDGDGKADFALYANGIWSILQSSDGILRIESFGLLQDKVVAGDYDGDGTADLAVYRSSDGFWYWLASSDGSFNGQKFGLSDDKPTPGDYDGDGITDLAVYRPSEGLWYLQQSTEGLRVESFGLSDDVPIPNVFER